MKSEVEWTVIIDTARIIRGAGSMWQPGVRSSVCPIYRPLQQRAAGLLLDAPWSASSVTFTAAVEGWTQICCYTSSSSSSSSVCVCACVVVWCWCRSVTSRGKYRSTSARLLVNCRCHCVVCVYRTVALHQCSRHITHLCRQWERRLPGTPHQLLCAPSPAVYENWQYCYHICFTSTSLLLNMQTRSPRQMSRGHDAFS